MADWLRGHDVEEIDPDEQEQAFLTLLDLAALQLHGDKDATAERTEAMDGDEMSIVLCAAIAFIADDMCAMAPVYNRSPEQLLADMRQEVVRRAAEVRLLRSERVGDG